MPLETQPPTSKYFQHDKPIDASDESAQSEQDTLTLKGMGNGKKRQPGFKSTRTMQLGKRFSRRSPTAWHIALLRLPQDSHQHAELKPSFPHYELGQAPSAMTT
ncbi:hypothetical protein S40288_10472 [Stachybotrys chartarum IBT 40288]|nr:hypothetical protein S40288_10472 [Stachybotrys chartarum IBT 40288]